MHEQTVADEHITLTDVATIAPGRPSANCVWRWCRRGILGRNGERIRLEHVRLGGKIFTRRSWLEEFGRRLAAADTRYFELSEAISHAAPDAPSSQRRSSHSFSEQRRQEIEAAERELDQKVRIPRPANAASAGEIQERSCARKRH